MTIQTAEFDATDRPSRQRRRPSKPRHRLAALVKWFEWGCAIAFILSLACYLLSFPYHLYAGVRITGVSWVEFQTADGSVYVHYVIESRPSLDGPPQSSRTYTNNFSLRRATPTCGTPAWVCLKQHLSTFTLYWFTEFDWHPPAEWRALSVSTTIQPDYALYAGQSCLLSLSLLAFCGWAVVRTGRTAVARRHRTAGSLCQVCHYDLTGNVSGICPECGTTFDAHSPD